MVPVLPNKCTKKKNNATDFLLKMKTVQMLPPINNLNIIADMNLNQIPIVS